MDNFKIVAVHVSTYRKKYGGRMDIYLLGTASAAGGADRENTYLLLQDQQEWVMVDVGGSSLQKLKKLEISLHDIRDVLFTHFHTDHIYGLPSLLWGMWLAKRTKPLNIHCAAENEPRLRSWLEWMEAKEWPILFPIHIQTFNWKEETEQIKGNDVTIRVFPSKHGVPTVGLRAQYQDKVIIYSADTALNERINQEIKIDLLIHEATSAMNPGPTHTGLKELAQFYELEKIAQVALVHLTDEEPYASVLAALPEEQKQKIKLGYDLMKLKV